MGVLRVNTLAVHRGTQLHSSVGRWVTLFCPWSCAMFNMTMFWKYDDPFVLKSG